jgi:hypothetical protein
MKSLPDMLGKSALAMYRRFPLYFSTWELEAGIVYPYACQNWGYLRLALETSLHVISLSCPSVVSFSTSIDPYPGEVTGGKIFGLFRSEHSSRTMYIHQHRGRTTAEASWGKVSEKAPFSAIKKAIQTGNPDSIEERIIIIHHNPPPADFVTFWNGSELSQTRKLLVICPNSTYTPPQLNGATFVQKLDDDGLAYLQDWANPFLPTDQELSNISLSVV